MSTWVYDFYLFAGSESVWDSPWSACSRKERCRFQAKIAKGNKLPKDHIAYAVA